MNRRQFLALTAAATAAPWHTIGASAGSEPSAIPSPGPASPEGELAGSPRGPWRRLFLDAAVVEEHSGLARLFHETEKHPGPVVKADKPWEAESAISGPYTYGTILRDGAKFRLWYQFLNEGNQVGYAESYDGVSWEKPELGLINFKGSTKNNIVVSAADVDATGGVCHNPSVIKLPGAEAGRRYSLWGFDSGSGHARVAFSPDGLRWKYAPETKKTALFTSSDVVNFFYDVYHSRFAATWKTRNRRGRAVGVAWAEEPLKWTKPVDGPVFVADDLDAEATQVYGMPVFPYQGLYIGLPWLYRARYFKFGKYSIPKMHEAQEDSPRSVDVEFAWSWDLINWTRPCPRSLFIRRGEKGAWDHGMIYTARAPVIRGDKLLFLYGGCASFHDDRNVRAAIGLASLRLDGFCSMRAGADEGWLITRREPFNEPAVRINAAARPDGFVLAEILNRRNKVVPGFSRRECVPFAGDAVNHRLEWKTGPGAKKLDGADYKIRFILKNADLFSYLPQGLNPNEPDLARF